MKEEQTPNESEQVITASLSCNDCGYAWTYSGKRKSTLCPRCRSRIRTIQREINPAEFARAIMSDPLLTDNW